MENSPTLYAASCRGTHWVNSFLLYKKKVFMDEYELLLKINNYK